jgi:hypothetical protein
MPIASFLNGVKFDRETTRVMGVAFEMTRIALGLADRFDQANELVAKRIIDLASPLRGARGMREAVAQRGPIFSHLRRCPRGTRLTNRLTSFSATAEAPKMLHAPPAEQRRRPEMYREPFSAGPSLLVIIVLLLVSRVRTQVPSFVSARPVWR